jgi:hypothetical protein
MLGYYRLFRDVRQNESESYTCLVCADSLLSNSVGLKSYNANFDVPFMISYAFSLLRYCFPTNITVQFYSMKQNVSNDRRGSHTKKWKWILIYAVFDIRECVIVCL